MNEEESQTPLIDKALSVDQVDGEIVLDGALPVAAVLKRPLLHLGVDAGGVDVGGTKAQQLIHFQSPRFLDARHFRTARSRRERSRIHAPFSASALAAGNDYQAFCRIILGGQPERQLLPEQGIHRWPNV